MIIQDDVFTFEKNDLSGFSDAIQRALLTAAGEGRTPEQMLSEAVNREVRAAAVSHKNSVLAGFEDLAEALAKAPDADAAAAEAKVDEARAVLGVTPIVLVPVGEDEPPVGFWARLFGS